MRRYLQNCIESILQQMYTDYELILVDDGSPDGCGAICDRYAQECDKVKVIHKKNGGLSSARNAGLAVAQGEYITFVDGDDTIASGTYYYNMQILLSNPDIDILEYPVVLHYESPDSTVISFEPQKISDDKLFPDWIRRKGYEHCFAWNKIYRSDLFFFIRYPEGEVFEDILIIPQLYEASENTYYSDCGFYYYYDHPESISNTYSFKSKFFIYRNLLQLHEKVSKKSELKEQAYDILFHCTDNLIDLFRCRDGEKNKYKEAAAMIKGKNISLPELYKLNMPIKRKIKLTTLALFGANIHCRLYALLHKKLN